MLSSLSNWDSQSLRTQLIDPIPNQTPRTLTVFLSPRADALRAHAEAVTSELHTRHPDDPIVSLNLEDMLADRIGPARFVWQRSLMDPSSLWGNLLLSLRALIPEYQTVRSWLETRTPLDEAAVDVVTKALHAGDFGSARTLLARYVRKRVENEEVDPIQPSHAERSLSEVDLLELLDIVLRSPPPPNTIRWVVVSGLESVLSDTSPNAQRLRKALRAFLRAARGWSRVSLVFSCWERAREELFRFDPAFLQFIQDPNPNPAPQLPLRVHAPALVRRFGAFLGMKFQERTDLDAFIAMRDDRLAAFIWPQNRVDPSEWIVSVTPRIARIFIGGRLALIVPSWAWGEHHEVSRQALQSAFPTLSWVPLSHCEAALFTQTQLDEEGEEVFESFLKRVRSSWVS